MSPPLYLLKLLSQDTRGFVISTELILVSSVAAIGIVGGLTALQNGVTQEFSATANDLQEMRRSFKQSTGNFINSETDNRYAPQVENCTETFLIE